MTQAEKKIHSILYNVYENRITKNEATILITLLIDEQVKEALEEVEKYLPSDDDLLMVGEKSRLPVKHFRDFTQEAINKLKKG